LTLQQQARTLLNRLTASDEKYSPRLLEDVSLFLEQLAELEAPPSLTASLHPEASLLSMLTPWLADVFTSAPLGQAEIYLSQFGTHVSVSWRNAQTGK
jgi:hypothetical protein